MSPFLLFAIPFSLVGWLIYRAIRYTSESVGEESPLHRAVVYQYNKWDFLTWTNTPMLVFFSFAFMWMSWLVLTNLNTATRPWHYLLAGSVLVLSVGFFYLVYKVSRLEERFWTIIKDTALALDPTTKSITVYRAGTSTVLTANTVALIESHITAQGKFSYLHFRFVDREGHATFFFDYGKGLGFALEDYFKGVPVKYVEHKFPFDTVPVS